jgi:hypothetical protein
VLNLRQQMLRPLLRDFDSVLARPIPKDIEALRLLCSEFESTTAPPGSIGISRPNCVAVAAIVDLCRMSSRRLSLPSASNVMWRENLRRHIVPSGA